jgi:hypothetical protein
MRVFETLYGCQLERKGLSGRGLKSKTMRQTRVPSGMWWTFERVA